MPKPFTVLIAAAAFIDLLHSSRPKIMAVDPANVTRFAFHRNFDIVEISGKKGHEDDGLLDLIDAHQLDSSTFIIRLQNGAELTSVGTQKIGGMIKGYMERHGCKQFGTRAISELDGLLSAKWGTILLTRDFKGHWSLKQLGTLSLQIVDGSYEITDGKTVATVSPAKIVSVLSDDEKLSALLAAGSQRNSGDFSPVKGPSNELTSNATPAA